MLELQDSKNIKFVAYLKFHGIDIFKVERLNRGKARYFFKMSEENWIDHKLKFNKSDELKYAQCLDSVVDLAH